MFLVQVREEEDWPGRRLKWTVSEPTWRPKARTGQGRGLAPPTGLSLGCPTSPPPPSTRGSQTVTFPGVHHPAAEPLLHLLVGLMLWFMQARADN